MSMRTRSLVGAATFIAFLTTACSEGPTGPTSLAPSPGSPASMAKGVGGGGGNPTPAPAVGPLSGTWILSSPVSTMQGMVTLTLNPAGTTYSGDMTFGFPELGLPFVNKTPFSGGYNPDGTIVFGYSASGGNPRRQPTLLLGGVLSPDGLTITGTSTAFWPGATFTMTKQ